ncbi:MAG: hypothetical protein ACT6Q9_09135 [Polaromonas sp.]|uniref:hypothetical protein n=1 Tax=Polaromonas sp. TaxID=1869339 RepID=UPI0040357025
MRVINLGGLVLAIAVVVLPATASAGIGKWLKKEAIPTLKGERPLEIKPYVAVKSDSVELKLGTNEAKLQVGNVKIQTHQLAKRLVQAGCIYATNGDVLRCAPDILERELLNIADGIDSNSASAGPATALPSYPSAAGYPTFDGFKSGTLMQYCGCWGFNPPPFAFEPRCSQSRVVLNQCMGACNAGGSPYAYTCM